jgi:hypothetical protein
MKRVLLGVLLGAVGLYGYQRLVHPRIAEVERAAPEEHQNEPPVEPAAEPATAREESFHCDGRVYCAEMTSCAEARYFLENCPGVKMDGEGDGVPCERQWCGSRP